MRDLIKTIGLYRNKARNVIALSEKLIAEHGGEVPRERAALEALPGVGRKTANVVLNMAFGEPTMAVDTHVFRVSNRTGLAPGKNPLDVELKLIEAIPAQFMMHAHHWLILHGRYTCLARKPLCEKCIIADLCRWPGKTVRPARLRGRDQRTSIIEGRLPDSFLCMCTIIAMPNSGVARLTIGIDTKAAISRPAVNTAD